MKGNKFTKNSIAVILKNRFYIEIIVHSDIEMEGNHEEIANKITFGKVQLVPKKE